MAKDPMVALHRALATLKLAQPEAFKKFMLAYETYGQGKMELLLRAPTNMLPVMQGQAQITQEFFTACIECVEKASKYDDQEKQRTS